MPRKMHGPVDEWRTLLGAARGHKQRLKDLLAISAYDRMIDEISWPAADALLWLSFGNASPCSLSTLRRDLRRWRLLHGRSRHGIPYAQLYVELHRATFALLGEGDEEVGAPLPLCPLPILKKKATSEPEPAKSREV